MGIWLWEPNNENKSQSKGLTVGLLSDDLFDVEAPSLSVDGLNLTLSALEVATHDLDGVTLADGNGADFVLGSQILAQMAAHDLSPDVGGSREVGLPGLSALA